VIRNAAPVRTLRPLLGPARRAVVVALAVLACTAAVAGTAQVAGAATAGGEVLVTPGTTRALTSGASTTPYGVVLPAGASCPGDTAHDGYHVFTYLVPAGDSPTDVSFRTGDPSKWYGYVAEGAYIGAINTAESTGQIVGLPTSFVWTRLTPQILFPDGAHTAVWNGGIACADTHGQVTDYWNSTIRFTADASDPHGFTWRVIDQGEVPTSYPVALWVGIALLVVAAGAAAYALRLRRRGSGPAAPSREVGSGPAPGGPGEDDQVSSEPPADAPQSERVGR
jgi:hypothetical protein